MFVCLEDIVVGSLDMRALKKFWNGKDVKVLILLQRSQGLEKCCQKCEGPMLVSASFTCDVGIPLLTRYCNTHCTCNIGVASHARGRLLSRSPKCKLHKGLFSMAGRRNVNLCGHLLPQDNTYS